MTGENFSPPPERFVMTTWHNNESIDDAVFHLWFCGLIDDAFPARVGVFILGASPDIRGSLNASIASQIPELDLLD